MATLDDLRRERDELTAKLANPAGLAREAFARMSARQAEIQGFLELAELVERTKQHVAEHEAELKSDDAELRALAAEELPTLHATVARLERDLEERLNPPDPHEQRNALLEIRAGAGGDEAALFARDLFSMYAKYAETQGWSLHLVSESTSDLGGVKEVIAEVRGARAYGTLQYESGVHRVQRIPGTEKSGRIHTSTATVAVLPVAEPKDLEIRALDLRIDTFRAGGHGGQHVQKTESAIRITHLPTGVVVTCQDERSQHANKERALSVLRSRLLAAQLETDMQKKREARRKQIGTGDRSEKIRTYNFAQDRVTDHRIKQSWHGLDRILGGDLEPLIEALRAASSHPK